MAKIYVDTNRFIDFYQAAYDDIDIFEQLRRYAHSLVLTEQTVAEFRRNRVRTLNWLVREFRKSLEVKPYTTSILRSLPEHRELTTIVKDFKAKGKAIALRLEALIADEEKDPVARECVCGPVRRAGGRTIRTKEIPGLAVVEDVLADGDRSPARSALPGVARAHRLHLELSVAPRSRREVAPLRMRLRATYQLGGFGESSHGHCQPSGQPSGSYSRPMIPNHTAPSSTASASTTPEMR